MRGARPGSAARPIRLAGAKPDSVEQREDRVVLVVEPGQAAAPSSWSAGPISLIRSRNASSRSVSASGRSASGAVGPRIRRPTIRRTGLSVRSVSLRRGRLVVDLHLVLGRGDPAKGRRSPSWPGRWRRWPRASLGGASRRRRSRPRRLGTPRPAESRAWIRAARGTGRRARPARRGAARPIRRRRRVAGRSGP